MELRDGDLSLRPWTEEDVPALVDACNEELIRRWLPAIPVPYTAEHALSYVRGEAIPDERTFAIAVDGVAHGSMGLRLNAHGYRASIGYWVAAPVRGRGLCTRALRLLSTYSLDQLELQRLELMADPDNLASQRVAEKVGYRREGVLRAHLRHPDGRIRDSVIFSLLPGELRD